MQKQYAFLPVLLCLSLIACVVEIDISVPSFPFMVSYFDTTKAMIQMTLALNFIGFCLAAIIYGPLSDAIGRRKVMLIGNGILAVGAIGCALSPNIGLLLAFRFIQGMGAATSAVVATAMIMDHYQESQATKLISIFNACFTILIALAPVMGGFIQYQFGWRGNYTIVAGISIISWLLLGGLLPETLTTRKPLNIKQVKNDFLKLLTNKTFMSTSLIPSLMYTVFICFIASAPFLYMKSFHLSLLSYTLNQAFVVGVFATTSLLMGKLLSKFSKGHLIHAAICLTIVGIISTYLASLWLSYGLFTLSMSLYAIGFAIAYPIIFTQSLEIFPELKGAASSLNMSLRAFVVSCFTALCSTIYTAEPLTLSLGLSIPFVLTMILMTIYLNNQRSCNT